MADRRPPATVGEVCPSGWNRHIGNLSRQAYPEQIERPLCGKECGGSNCRFVVESSNSRTGALGQKRTLASDRCQVFVQ